MSEPQTSKHGDPPHELGEDLDNVIDLPKSKLSQRPETALLSGRVSPSVRQRAMVLAEQRGISIGQLLAEFIEGERHRAVAPPVLEEFPPGPFGTILADPPWRFANRTGKVAPEHRRLSRYDTMPVAEIAALPVDDIAADQSHLYLWVPNALLREGLEVMEAWGFQYKGNLVWHKVRKDGGSDGRGVGFYFRNVTELVLFGARGNLRTLAPARSQVNLLATRKREHSRKPDELYPIIEACSPGPRIELFARYLHKGWTVWGDESSDLTIPRGRQYAAYS